MSLYHDFCGAAYDRKYVLINEMDGELFCLGIYEDMEKAVGSMALSIWEFSESYEEDGDEFYCEKPTEWDSDSGVTVKIRFRHHSWDKECAEYYHILFFDTRQKDKDRIKEEK